jgi:hypothetical protein
VFTARYALSPYIKWIRFVFKGLKSVFEKLDGKTWPGSNWLGTRTDGGGGGRCEGSNEPSGKIR